MGPSSHLANWAVLALVAWLLTRAPRSLFAEAGGRKPSARSEGALAAGLLAVGVASFEAWRGGDPLARLALGVALMVFAAVVVSDLRFLTIPDLYSGALALLALVGPLAPGIFVSLVGAVFCGGLLALVAWLWKRRSAVDGLGLGDVKLAAAIGALLGPEVGLWAVTASAAAGAVLGLILQARQKDAAAPLLFPYGAPLALAGAGFILWSVLR